MSSSSPSVAMLPEGFFRGGLERRRTRLTLSRITWVQTGGQSWTGTQVAPRVWTPWSARTCHLLPCLSGGHGADIGDSTSACHPPCPRATEGCWGTHPPTASCWQIPDLGAVIALWGGHAWHPLPGEPSPQSAPRLRATTPFPPLSRSPEGSAHLVDIVQDLQDGEDAGTDEQAHLSPDVPWGGGGGDGHQELLCSPQGAQGGPAGLRAVPGLQDGGGQSSHGGRSGRTEGAGDMQDRGRPAACHPSASLQLAPALCGPSPTGPTSSWGWDTELHASGSHGKVGGVTEKPSKVVGFLLLNGLVVERLEEDVQHQEVLPVGTLQCSARRACHQLSHPHCPPNLATLCPPAPPAPRCSQGPGEFFRPVRWGHRRGMSKVRRDHGVGTCQQEG